MTEIWTQAALWLDLALAASPISIRLRVVTALSEIVVGANLLGAGESWIKFLAGGIGLVSFAAPFLGCTALAYRSLGRPTRRSSTASPTRPARCWWCAELGSTPAC